MSIKSKFAGSPDINVKNKPLEKTMRGLELAVFDNRQQSPAGSEQIISLIKDVLLNPERVRTTLTQVAEQNFSSRCHQLEAAPIPSLAFDAAVKYADEQRCKLKDKIANMDDASIVVVYIKSLVDHYTMEDVLPVVVSHQEEKKTPNIVRVKIGKMR